MRAYILSLLLDVMWLDALTSLKQETNLDLHFK